MSATNTIISNHACTDVLVLDLLQLVMQQVSFHGSLPFVCRRWRDAYADLIEHRVQSGQCKQYKQREFKTYVGEQEKSSTDAACGAGLDGNVEMLEWMQWAGVFRIQERYVKVRNRTRAAMLTRLRFKNDIFVIHNAKSVGVAVLEWIHRVMGPLSGADFRAVSVHMVDKHELDVLQWLQSQLPQNEGEWNWAELERSVKYKSMSYASSNVEWIRNVHQGQRMPEGLCEIVQWIERGCNVEVVQNAKRRYIWKSVMGIVKQSEQDTDAIVYGYEAPFGELFDHMMHREDAEMQDAEVQDAEVQDAEVQDAEVHEDGEDGEDGEDREDGEIGVYDDWMAETPQERAQRRSLALDQRTARTLLQRHVAVNVVEEGVNEDGQPYIILEN